METPEKSTQLIHQMHIPSTTDRINDIFGRAALISHYSVPWYDKEFISNEAKNGTVRSLCFTANRSFHSYRNRNNMELSYYHDFISRDFHKGTYFFRDDDWEKVAEHMATVIKVPIAGDSEFEKSNHVTIRNILIRAGFTTEEANEIMHIKEMKEAQSFTPTEMIKILRNENPV